MQSYVSTVVFGAFVVLAVDLPQRPVRTTVTSVTNGGTSKVRKKPIAAPAAALDTIRNSNDRTGRVVVVMSYLGTTVEKSTNARSSELPVS